MKLTTLTKHQYTTYLAVLALVASSLYGVIHAYNVLEDYTTERLDTYATDRVKNRQLIDQSVLTKTVEVPVVKESEVKKDVHEAIGESLK